MERGYRTRYILRAKDEEERDLWVRVLQEESSRFLPLHDFFQKLRWPAALRLLLCFALLSKLTYFYLPTCRMYRNPKEVSLGERPLDIPKPIAEGWMRKRSSNTVTWNKRYFVLFPDFDGGGITLFYFMSQQLGQRMIDFGLQVRTFIHARMLAYVRL